jgi:hypothetical protein
MASGQIDPARLDGDALRQWYLRSPADIEEEKRQAAARAYDAFFSQPEDTQRDDGWAAAPGPATGSPADASNGGDRIWRQVGPNRFQSARASADSMPASDADAGYQLAAATFPAWGRWPINGCVNCHNPQTGDLLPGSSPTPRPPMFIPREGGSGGSSSRRGQWGDKPQCDQQFEMDREICQRVQNPECWVNQLRRLQHCEQTGEVNEPGLRFGPPGRR